MHDLYRFLEFLNKSKHAANYFPTILQHIKTIIQKNLSVTTSISNETMEDLFQTIGLIIAHKSTPTNVAIETIKVKLINQITLLYRNIIVILIAC